MHLMCEICECDSDIEFVGYSSVATDVMLESNNLSYGEIAAMEGPELYLLPSVAFRTQTFRLR